MGRLGRALSWRGAQCAALIQTRPPPRRRPHPSAQAQAANEAKVIKTAASRTEAVFKTIEVVAAKEYEGADVSTAAFGMPAADLKSRGIHVVHKVEADFRQLKNETDVKVVVAS